MKASIIHLSIAFVMIIACYSCEKEFSCEGCRDGNIPPKAVSGPDQVVKLPLDSVLLDGSASSDPDGSIVNCGWRKIDGPAAFNIISPTDSITRIRSLIPGIYQFELTVTDNGGLSSMDTVQVTVNDIGQTNRPPIANAGPDKVVADSLTLDGSASSDPDNNIASYQWTKISGPSSLVSNPNAVRTLVSNLDSGFYFFELKVTDAGGLFSKDTVQISVTGRVVNVACDSSTRPIIDAQLLPVTLLPLGSGDDFVVLGNKVYFMAIECPTCTGPTKKRAYYNIFDLATQTWSKSSEYLMTPRKYGATIIATANRIFYAGGAQSDPPNNYFAVLPDVDIYDVTNNTWSSTKLSAGGMDIAGTVAGNKVLFAGGLREDPVKLAKPSAIVDMYDLSNNTWSVASLKEGRADISAVTANGKVYFAGGSAGVNAISGFLGAIDVIDIYDIATDTWSLSSLAKPKTKMTGITFGNKVFWAGGLGEWEEWEADVEIRDINSQTSTRACLFQEKYWDHGKNGAALINNNKIVFFTGVETSDIGYNTRFDIYDVNSNTWSVGQLPFDISGASIFTYNNTIYVAGGRVNGAVSTQIWKLTF